MEIGEGTGGITERAGVENRGCGQYSYEDIFLSWDAKKNGAKPVVGEVI